MSDYELDARRMLCPMPVIRTQDKVKTLSQGDRLKVVCTDPGAKQDIPAWCRINGHRLIDSQEIENEIILTIEVGMKEP